MASETKKESVYVGTPLDAEKHAKLNKLAKANDRKIAAEVRIAINRHLNTNEGVLKTS